jgi:hypothetical protein
MHVHAPDTPALKVIPLFGRVAENDLKELAKISALRRFESRSIFRSIDPRIAHVLLYELTQCLRGSSFA